MKLIGIAFACTAAFAASGAHANCAQLVEAFEKSGKQPRVAQYDVDSREQPLTGKPDLVRIGKVFYDRSTGVYERLETDGTDPVFAALREAIREGTVRCESGGNDTYRGSPVTKIRFDNPLVPKNYNPSTVWIDKRSGLLVYQEVTGLGPGGFAMIYGDAVKEPVAGK